MNKEKELQIAAPGILSRVLHDVADEVEGFSAISRGKYFLKRIAIEQSDSKEPALALSLIYLQDHENFRETMDEEVAQAVRESLASHKLTATVRDVVVNMIHFRNDVRKN